MLGFAIRAALSGVIVALIAIVGRRSPVAGAIVASLPIVSILGMSWLWRDTRDPVLVAAHAEATFWYVLPSLPMFLLIPALMRHGWRYEAALGAGCALTIALYLVTAAIAARAGVSL